MCLPYYRDHDVPLSPGSVTRTHLSGAAWTAPSCPGKRNPCAWVRVHEGQTRPLHVSPGVESARSCFRYHEASGPIRFRGWRDGGKAPEGARAAPGPRFKERGAGRGAGRGARGGAGRGVRLQPRQAEPALPRGGARAVLTLAAEPEVVRGCGQRWPVVAFPSSRAPRSRRPAVCGPRAPASRPPGPASPGLPRSARPRPGGRSQRPGLRASSLRRPEGRRAGGRRAGEPDGGWGRWRRREHGRQAANPHGQREAQQEHHPARQRRQDLEERSRREGVRRTLVIGPLHFCCLWFCNFPDYSKYQDGHVK